MEFPDHPFWDFSLAVYGTPGVPPACLALQEKHRIDVNILLFCCWIGVCGREALSLPQVKHLVEAVDPWHQAVVRGLRAVRKKMKAGLDNAPADLAVLLRQRIAATEIDCEHVEQLMLASLIEDPGPMRRESDPVRKRDAVWGGFDSYFNQLNCVVDDVDRECLGVLVDAAFAWAEGKMPE